jgi:hypothetical protein|tara:strand:- start:966 stop:1175 length:210 start_codon:yes stop_codon:yes gene_type:complete
MTAVQINDLLDRGWWIQVSPLANAGSGWICGVYKKGKKTGNWVTESSRQFKTPSECYHWANLKIKYEEL